MPLFFYNTLTKYLEEFQPINKDMVGIYSCGPTVYDYAHLGNYRSFLFADFLCRALKYLGYEVKHVMNITDVGHLVSDEDEGEDKIIKGARREKKTPWEIAKFYTDNFLENNRKLNIREFSVLPKATDHIDDMIKVIKKIEQNGYAYETSDGLYFDVSLLKNYGRLSGIKLEKQLAGARIDVNPEKRNPADFALWKKAEPGHIMQWESPWGTGYPGWHIECTAMSVKYLGELFDIHTGGEDHIPVHHENEIAQAIGAFGTTGAKFWMHGAFLKVDGGKMSKSLDNFYTIKDLEDRNISPLAFRYFCLNAHYHGPHNFTWDVIQAAHNSYQRLLGAFDKLKEVKGKSDNQKIESYRREFKEALEDDLNLPQALVVLWKMARNEEENKADYYNLALEFDLVLGLNIKEGLRESENVRFLPFEIRELLEERNEARREKNWKLADECREKIRSYGYEIKDTPLGTTVIQIPGFKNF